MAEHDVNSKEQKIFRQGETVGRYVITRWIPGGRGGMATVYQAQLPGSPKSVALKVAHSGLGDFLKDEAGFLRILDLDHPHIIKILPSPVAGTKDYIVRDPETDSWYFAMEYMPGGSLDDWLQKRKRLRPQEALEIVRQVGSALDAAHKLGVLHLDVKPSTILFREDPRQAEQLRVVLADFGIARAQGRAGRGNITLTIEYASPEQAKLVKGEEPEPVIDHRSDLYSLAVLLYEMLRGRVPFKGKDNEQVLQAIAEEDPPLPLKGFSEGVNQVLAKALAKNPDDRYQSAREMVEALEAVVPQQSRDRRRSRGPMALPLVTGILGIIGGFIIGMLLGASLVTPSTAAPERTVVVTATPLPTQPFTATSAPLSATNTSVATHTPGSTPTKAFTPTYTPTPRPSSTSTKVPPTSTLAPSPTKPPTKTPTPTTPVPTATPQGTGDFTPAPGRSETATPAS